MLAVVCLSFSVGETFAQERDFANSARFAKEEFYKLKYCSTVVYMVPRA